MAAAKNPADSGAPKWTYVVATLVAVGTLVWAVASHFIPKAEESKPAGAGGTSVTVSGSGNVAVGTMSGGQISVGSGGAAAPASGASR